MTEVGASHLGRDDTSSGVTEWCPARAALAGNPSDGYGGAVCAIPVTAYGATVHVAPRSNGYRVADALSGAQVFERWSDLEHALRSVTAATPHCLTLGALAAISGRFSEIPPLSLSVATTIPMSVGLAGSSAIVVASLRALLRTMDDALAPDELAQAALEVETERLGIAAGLQDRVVQAYAQPMLMNFDGQERLDGRSPFQPVSASNGLRLLVAHRATLSEPSHVVHGDLRRRFLDGDQQVANSMAQLAQLAADAAQGFSTGNAELLGSAMDATYDLRATMLDLAPGHVEMIDAARSARAHANYTGSGGAVVVLCPTPDVEGAVRQSLNGLSCSIVSVDTAAFVG